ncbi:uncharacterized protein LOC129581019 isoform X2 [Paramacrobiotus metropolitanus]|uniref:uncharacterized protein LOC129581019 isoform X2 n=1 Tax=Paramacrobiotus metropolitanus TaxID=2943436 RepID=UPI00244616C2|nr:uncharacterized protein LOC129581019 isoform X2 [Paramacrobiotus metropolitanus]
MPRVSAQPNSKGAVLNKFTDAESENLLAFVKVNRSLWDTKLKEYIDTKSKVDVWNAIAQLIGEYNCTPRKKRKREGYDQLIKQLSESQRRDDELAAETSNVLKSFFGEQSTQGKKISTTEELFCDFVLSTLNSTTAEQKERIKKGIQNVIAKELLNNESSTERTGKSIC